MEACGKQCHGQAVPDTHLRDPQRQSWSVLEKLFCLSWASTRAPVCGQRCSRRTDTYRSRCVCNLADGVDTGTLMRKSSCLCKVQRGTKEDGGTKEDEVVLPLPGLIAPRGYSRFNAGPPRPRMLDGLLNRCKFSREPASQERLRPSGWGLSLTMRQCRALPWLISADHCALLRVYETTALVFCGAWGAIELLSQCEEARAALRPRLPSARPLPPMLLGERGLSRSGPSRGSRPHGV